VVQQMVDVQMVNVVVSMVIVVLPISIVVQVVNPNLVNVEMSATLILYNV